jgi:hypothetical protein
VQRADYFGADQTFAAAAGPSARMPAITAKPFAWQAVGDFPHGVEPTPHLARVPNNVVSGEVNSDGDQDRAAVHFGVIAETAAVSVNATTAVEISFMLLPHAGRWTNPAQRLGAWAWR